MHEKALAEPIRIGMNHNQADLLFFLLCVNFDALETISKTSRLIIEKYGELIAKLHIELRDMPKARQRQVIRAVHAG